MATKVVSERISGHKWFRFGNRGKTPYQHVKVTRNSAKPALDQVANLQTDEAKVKAMRIQATRDVLLGAAGSMAGSAPSVAAGANTAAISQALSGGSVNQTIEDDPHLSPTDEPDPKPGPDRIRSRRRED